MVSPDGTQVAFADEGKVWVVAAAGGPAARGRRGRQPGVARRRPARRLRRARRRAAGSPSSRSTTRGRSRSCAPHRGLDANGDEGGAAVSPDGSTVAFRFRSHTDLTRSEIRVVDVATGEARALTGAPGIEEGEPAWSPDGRTLAFTAQRERVVGAARDRARRPATSACSPPSRRTSPSRRGAATDRGSRLSRSKEFSYDLVRRRRVHGRGDGASRRAAATARRSGRRTGRSSSRTRTTSTPPELRRLRPTAERERLVAAAPAVDRSARRTSSRRRSRSRPPTGSRSARSSTGRARASVPRRPSSIRTAGRRSSRATSGTAWPSTSSTRATPGCRINYRGSTGRGKAFEHLNDLDWGGGDVRDCLAAADYLRTLDWVDGERLAIFGASYGSYMALCAAVEDAGERFRCAVCKYGDCDLVTTWAQGDWRRHPVLRREHARSPGSQPRRLPARVALPPARTRRGAAARRRRGARRARQCEPVGAARRRAAPARKDVRVRHVSRPRRTASCARGRSSTSTAGSSGSSTGTCSNAT